MENKNNNDNKDELERVGLGPQRLDGLISVSCECEFVIDHTSCDYLINNGTDIINMTLVEIIDRYEDHCDPPTTTTTTTSTTTTTTTTTTSTTTYPIDRCAVLPVIEVGYWQCMENVCIIKCQQGETAHLTVAIQCLCVSKDSFTSQN